MADAKKLTIKQEKFCNKYLECGNASEAYRFAYDCSKMKDETINERSSRLLKEYKISTRVNQLQAQLAEKELITKEEIVRLNISIINADVLDFVNVDMVEENTEFGVRQVPSVTFHVRYLQPIITQYFIDNKSEIWLLFLIAHSKR